MFKNIEYVCLGNMERSPLAEAFAKKDLDQKGLADLVSVSSSGTGVDSFKKTGIYNLENLEAEELIQAVMPYVSIAVQRGFITPEQAEALKESRDLKKIVSQLKKAVIKDGLERNRTILDEKGLLEYYDFNRKPVQTVVRPEAELIFPVDQKNYEEVVKIYSGSGITPIIRALGDINDPFLATLEKHRRIADQIEEATIEELEKFLK